MKTPYETLGVPRSADEGAIRAALRRAAKKYHPDVNRGDANGEQQLKEAIAAYELLMDPSRRAAYDGYLQLRRRKTLRRFLTTALASASVVSGVSLALAIWLAKPSEVSVAAGEQSVATPEAAAPANLTAAVFGHAVFEEAAYGVDDIPAATSAPSPAGEWAQIVENGDPLQIWVIVLRNPETAEAELARAWLMHFIDATEDLSLLNVLRASEGVLAERAQRRLNDLSAASTVEEHVPAAAAAGDGEAKTPPDLAHYLERGLLRLGKADFDGAIADFDAAIGLEPQNALAHRYRGSAWGGKGDRDRALADFELALRISPDDPAIFTDRGAYWRRTGALDLALVDLDRAIRLGFSDARAYNERGLVWHEKGRYERAIADFTRAIKIDPSRAAAYMARGKALHDKGDLAGSAADLEHASHIEANQPVADPELTGSAR